jgi:hypothetical protein
MDIHAQVDLRETSVVSLATNQISDECVTRLPRSKQWLVTRRE